MPGNVEPQGSGGPFAGVVDADAGRWAIGGAGVESVATNRPLAAEVRSRPLSARVMPSARQSLPGPARARGSLADVPASGSAARIRTAPGLPVGLADEVHAVVHAVDQVDVQVPGRAEHDRRPRRRPPAGVRGRDPWAPGRPRPRRCGRVDGNARRPSARAACPAVRGPPPRSGGRRSGGRAAAGADGRRQGHGWGAKPARSRAGRGTARGSSRRSRSTWSARRVRRGSAAAAASTASAARW